MESTKKDWNGLYRQLEEKLNELQAELHTLEVQAGIDVAVKEAMLGTQSPPDESGEYITYAEGLARHRKRVTRHLMEIRSKIRDLYFSVSDNALRIKLITTHRRIDQVERQLAENEVERYTFLVEREVLRAEKPLCWLGSAVIGMVVVTLGYSGFGVLGAICGAVFGIFLGQEGTRRYFANAKKEVAARRRTLKEEKGKADRVLSRPVGFCKEEESGLRNADFDHADVEIRWEWCSAGGRVS